jgi:hypothetical protein
MVERPDEGWHGRHIISDRPADDVRVVTWPDDGHQVEVIGWSPGYPGKQLLAWKANFDGSTPQDVVLAAIAVATGQLAVTR